MPKFKYDSTKVDRSKQGGFVEPPPSGSLQKCKVTQCKVGKSKASGGVNEQLELIYTVLDGPHAGYKFYDYIPTNLDFRIDTLLAAVGFDTVGKPKGEFDTDKDILNKEILVRTKGDSYTKLNEETGESETTYRAKPGFLLKPGTGGGAAAAKPAEKTWTEKGGLIDAGADDGTYEVEMNSAAEKAGVDPNSYDTWEALGEFLDAPAEEGSEEPESGEAEGAADDTPDYAALGAAADGDDEDAIAKLTELAEAAGLDINDFGPWADLAAALAGDPFSS